MSADCCIQDTAISSGVVLINLLKRQGDTLSFWFKEIPPPSYNDFCRSGDVQACSSNNSAPIGRVEEGSQATVVQSKRSKINVDAGDVFFCLSTTILAVGAIGAAVIVIMVATGLIK